MIQLRIRGLVVAAWLCLAVTAGAESALTRAASAESRQSVMLENPAVWTSILAGRAVTADGTGAYAYVIGVTVKPVLNRPAESATREGNAVGAPVLRARAVLSDGRARSITAIPITEQAVASETSEDEHFSFLVADIDGAGPSQAVDIQVRVDSPGSTAIQPGSTRVTVEPIRTSQDPHRIVRF